MGRLSFLIAALITIAPGLYAQNCATDNIKPKTGVYGYKQRTGDQRCEGLFTEKISGQTLDVMSFTQGRLRYRLSKDEGLTISVPVLPTSKEIKVRGTSFGMYDSYRLDLEVGAKDSKRVPVNEVLEPNKISEKNLGVYGYVQNNKKETVYVPVTVSAKLYNDRIEESETNFLKLIPNTTIEKAEWKYAENVNGICQTFSDYTLIKGSVFSPQVPMIIELPESMKQGAACVNIRYKTVAGEWNNKTFQLFIP